MSTAHIEKNSNRRFIEFLTMRSCNFILLLTLPLSLCAAAVNVESTTVDYTMSDFTTFLGRFHPMILHFPIGLLMGLLIVEIYAFLRPSKKLDSASWILLLTGSVSALAACILGLFLSWADGGSGYNEELLSDHKWMGFGVAGLSLLLVLIKWKLGKQQKPGLLKAYRFGLIFCFMLMGAAGHDGGSLSHGSNYLYVYMPPQIKKFFITTETKDPLTDKTFLEVIHPILENNCFDCHGEDKQKGDLRLDQPENYPTLKGESGEHVIVAGNAMASSLVASIIHPKDHEDIMPPKGDPLKSDEIMQVIHWINSGAVTGPLNNTSEKKKASVAKKTTGEFATKIWPIIKERCLSCHSAQTEKKKKNPKGGVRLDTPEWIRRGEVEDGEDDIPIIIPGEPEKSSFYTTVVLPEGNDDIMPAKGDPLTKEQCKAIYDWIKNGADYGDWVPDEVGTQGNAHAQPTPTPLPSLPQGALDKLKQTGALVMALAQNDPRLQVNFLSVKGKTTDSYLEALTPLKDYVVWLNLSNTQITSEGLKHLSALNKLERLNLSKTKIDDIGLVHLKSLPNLEYLNLYGTGVSDAGLNHLNSLNKLKKLFLWQSKVSKEGAATLKASLPQLEINMGWEAKEIVPPPAVDESKDDSNDKKSKVDFTKDIWPVIKERCVDCHGIDNKKKKAKAGLRLDTPEWIKRGVVDEGEDDSPVIVAGKPEESSFYTLVILPEDDDDVMPPKDGLLTKEQQELIKRWIEEGASFEGWKK